MRSKKLLAFLNLLPTSPEVENAKTKLLEKSVKTKNFILKAKRIGRYLLEIYLIISYLLQTLGIV